MNRPRRERLMMWALAVASIAIVGSAVVTDARTMAVPAQSPTFTKDIAPILFARCAECHHPGGPAPFSLLTYSAVRQRAQLIATVTGSGLMPPWKPDEGYGEFVGERRLSGAHIQLIHDWVEQGAPEGDSRDLPPVPVWPDNWQLGQPDVIAQMSEPYMLGSTGSDVLRTFVIPIPVNRRRFVKGVEFRADDNRAIHHATLRIDQTRMSRWLDEQDPQPGYEGALALDARYPPGHFLVWAPGQLRPVAEDGFSWRLEPGTDLVVQLHLVPSGRPEPIRVSVGFFLTDTPPTRTPSVIRLSRQDLDIPAGEPHYVVEDRYVVPVDVDVREIQPHAHLLARRIEGLAKLPDGTTRPLIKISDWDFRWQDVYRFKEPLHLPAGTTLIMRIAYDNSSANIRNPFSPPQRIQFGERTSDEMALLWLQVLPRSANDFAVLERDFARKLLADDVMGYEYKLHVEPENPQVHEALASAYFQLGRAADAIAQLEISVRIDPASAIGRYNLGATLAVLGRGDDAIVQLEEAIRLKPDLAYAHSSLGDVLQERGRFDEAIAHYRAALAIEPTYARVHNNLGSALQASGRLDEALVHYERAVGIIPDDPVPERNWAKALTRRGKASEAVAHFRTALQSAPDSPAALGELAWLLATHPDESIRAPNEAVRLAERAAALESQNPVILDILSSAYAAAGQFERAIAVANSAVQLALQRDADRLASAIRDRARLYATRHAYVHDFAGGFDGEH